MVELKEYRYLVVGKVKCFIMYNFMRYISTIYTGQI